MKLNALILMAQVKGDVLFESSWEVCNKVGGIYTVVLSKAALINQEYANYYLVGPYFEEKARQDFVKEKLPEELKQVFLDLEKEGIKCHFGTWIIKGDPKAILIDFKDFVQNKNQIKTDLWNNYKIDSLKSGWDFDEPVIWSVAVGKLIEKYVQYNNTDNKLKIIGQFHEWMAGVSLLYLQQKKVKIATVFTTHATMLGRSICGSGGNLYEGLDSIKPTEAAYNLGVQDKYLTEKACALNCDIFTTVSQITSIEAEKILGRKADVLVLNGLDLEKFPTFEETSIKHRENREVAREFAAYYFFPYYNFDLEETIFFYIVGRYEFKNKGIDVMVKALARLNDRLKAENHKKTVVVFLWIPREVHGAKAELSSNKVNYLIIEDFIRKNAKNIQIRLINTALTCGADCFNINTCSIESPKGEPSAKLFERDFLLELKRLRINFGKVGNPLIITHNIPYEDKDIIFRTCIDTGLDNKPDDKVKIVYYPVYLTGVDGLLDLPYYEALMACHLGIFPSYYEPWGYTPLESAALGVPAITTDLSGFGMFLKDKGAANNGIWVLERYKKSEDDVIDQLTGRMHEFCELNEKGRVRLKIRAKETAGLADWKELVVNYYEAHNRAVEKAYNKNLLNK